MTIPFFRKQKLLSRFGLWQSGEIPVRVDNNPDLGYEKINWWYYPLMIPLTLILAFWVALKKKIFGPRLKINFFMFDGLSPLCRTIKENATTWKALDIIYNYSSGQDPTFVGKLNDFWNNLLSVRATRNRLRLTKYYLKKEIEEALKKFSKVRLFSVASGSAQGVLEVLEEFKEKPIEAIFLDLDKSALAHSRKMAEKMGVQNKIYFINKSAREIEEIGKNFSPHIVEVVGFLMYRPYEKAIALIQRIYHILALEGVLLVSQDNHILEEFFIHQVANWPIIFRSPSDFIDILIKGGFRPENCKIIYEPLKMHGLAICKKNI
ncbi:MAG: class I SAM-dependent methyltransferase family protein [Minisyncoccales bacterium]